MLSMYPRHEIITFSNKYSDKLLVERECMKGGTIAEYKYDNNRKKVATIFPDYFIMHNDDSDLYYTKNL